MSNDVHNYLTVTMAFYLSESTFMIVQSHHNTLMQEVIWYYIRVVHHASVTWLFIPVV